MVVNFVFGLLLQCASSTDIPLGLHNVVGKVSWRVNNVSIGPMGSTFKAAVMVYTGATADIWSYDGETGAFRADFSKQAASDESSVSANVGDVSSSFRNLPLGVVILCLAGVSAHGLVSTRVAAALILALVAVTVVSVKLPSEATGKWKVDVSENTNFAGQKCVLALDVKNDGSFSANPEPWFSIPTASVTGTIQTAGASMVPEVYVNLAQTVTDDKNGTLNISADTVNGKNVTGVYRANPSPDAGSWGKLDDVGVPFVCWTFDDGSSTSIRFWGDSPLTVRLTSMNGGCLGGSEGAKTDYKTSWTTTPPSNTMVASTACRHLDSLFLALILLGLNVI